MKRLKFLLIATFFVAAFSIHARAQVSTETDAEADPYKREFGFGTNIILNNIFNSQSAPLDFMYKWKSGNGYLRLGTSLGYSKADDVHSKTEKAFWESFGANLSFGKEWRQEISRRWELNYGTDLGLNYRQSFGKNENLNFQNGSELVNVNKRYSQNYGVSLRPFLGIMFKINQRLYLGTEASFTASLSKNKMERESYQLENGKRIIGDQDFVGLTPENGFNVNIRTNPASNIFVYYRF